MPLRASRAITGAMTNPQATRGRVRRESELDSDRARPRRPEYQTARHGPPSAQVGTRRWDVATAVSRALPSVAGGRLAERASATSPSDSYEITTG